jgi:prepilin-type N-terminal cleavage/methylation domain-containing protein
LQSFIEINNKINHLMQLMYRTNKAKDESGFTLVELMVAVFLTAIATIGIYRGYTSFSQTSDAQEQIIEMQQNLRIGMYRLEKDLRRAGMKEEEGENVGFPQKMDNTLCCFDNSIAMTIDLTGGETDGVDNDHDEKIDGADTDPFPFDESVYGDDDTDDPGEEITYSVDGNGNLIRDDVNGGGPVTIISNVDALNFIYLKEDRSRRCLGHRTTLCCHA